jgi:hypothetical protein
VAAQWWVMVGNGNMDAGIVENLEYSRAAAEANEYSAFAACSLLQVQLTSR